MDLGKKKTTDGLANSHPSPLLQWGEMRACMTSVDWGESGDVRGFGNPNRKSSIAE